MKANIHPDYHVIKVVMTDGTDFTTRHDSNTARRAAGLYTHGPERAHPRDMGRALRGCLTVRAIGCPIPPPRRRSPEAYSDARARGEVE